MLIDNCQNYSAVEDFSRGKVESHPDYNNGNEKKQVPQSE